MRRLAVVSLLAVVLAGSVGAGPAPDPLLFKMTVEVVAEVSLRCEATALVAMYAKQQWWVVLKKRAEALAEALRCGAGAPPETVTPGESLLPPILTQFSRKPERVISVEITVGAEARMEVRDVYFVASGTVTIPLQREAPQIFLSLVAGPSDIESGKGRGSLWITSDAVGASVLLDSGVIGYIPAEKELILSHLAPGLHEVIARDASGRERREIVQIAGERIATVDLSLSSERPINHGAILTGRNLQGFEEFRRNRDGALMVKIPAGEFLMGNARTERTPLEHRVHLSDYLIDKALVTWRQYKKFAADTRESLPPNKPFWGIHDDHPAVFISWDEARGYCEWAGARLPTEAEWEKGARGTDDRKYPWGDEEPEPRLAVFRRSWGFEGTDPVGSHPDGDSPYGLHDMAGSVWEWTMDWYEDAYYADSPRRDPRGPRTGQAHAVRGGSWDSRPSVLSCSCRNWGQRGYREGDFGFRCASTSPR